MKRLKELRKINNISQNELADALCVKVSTISQYERGLREPRIEMLVKIANYFNVSVDYLVENDIGGENLIYVPSKSRQSIEKILQNDLAEIMSDFFSLDEAGKKAVETYIKIYNESKK